MHDVAAASNGWVIGEHPWEGGSDHDVFLGRNIPAILMWHFTDFAYHTSLDRLSHVDPRIVRRMSVALLTAAMAVADPRPEDFDRYRQTIENNRALRGQAARKNNDQELLAQWNDWCNESIRWFENLCQEKSDKTSR